MNSIQIIHLREPANFETIYTRLTKDFEDSGSDSNSLIDLSCDIKIQEAKNLIDKVKNTIKDIKSIRVETQEQIKEECAKVVEDNKTASTSTSICSPPLSIIIEKEKKPEMIEKGCSPVMKSYESVEIQVDTLAKESVNRIESDEKARNIEWNPLKKTLLSVQNMPIINIPRQFVVQPIYNLKIESKPMPNYLLNRNVQYKEINTQTDSDDNPISESKTEKNQKYLHKTENKSELVKFQLDQPNTPTYTAQPIDANQAAIARIDSPIKSPIKVEHCKCTDDSIEFEQSKSTFINSSKENRNYSKTIQTDISKIGKKSRKLQVDLDSTAETDVISTDRSHSPSTSKNRQTKLSTTNTIAIQTNLNKREKISNYTSHKKLEHFQSENENMEKLISTAAQTDRKQTVSRSVSPCIFKTICFKPNDTKSQEIQTDIVKIGTESKKCQTHRRQPEHAITVRNIDAYSANSPRNNLHPNLTTCRPQQSILSKNDDTKMKKCSTECGFSSTTDQSLSEGEIECKCSLSNGEIHSCKIRKKSHHYKLNPESLFKREFRDNWKVQKERVYYDNWVSYSRVRAKPRAYDTTDCSSSATTSK